MRGKRSQLTRWTSQFLFLSLLAALFVSSVNAYTDKVENELKSARDALKKQQSDLESLINNKATQVDKLQSEIDRLKVYLKDTDRALENVDSALKGR